jgi:hypothetical protein
VWNLWSRRGHFDWVQVTSCKLPLRVQQSRPYSLLPTRKGAHASALLQQEVCVAQIEQRKEIVTRKKRILRELPSLLVSKRGTQDAGHGTRDTGRGTQDAGRGTRDTGHRTRCTGRGAQDAVHRTRCTGRGARDARDGCSAGRMLGGMQGGVRVYLQRGGDQRVHDGLQITTDCK